MEADRARLVASASSTREGASAPLIRRTASGGDSNRKGQVAHHGLQRRGFLVPAVPRPTLRPGPPAGEASRHSGSSRR